MGRREHFHESAGNPIVGYNTGEEIICKNCGSNDPEYALVDPSRVMPVRLRDVGEGSGAYPGGFTCPSCGDTVGSWGE